MNEARTLDLQTLALESGAHEPGAGYSVMEAVAYLDGEPWTDAPSCTGPGLGAFCRALNDAPEPIGAANRERLRAYVPALLGAAGTPDVERMRGLMALDWLIREYLPAWLRLTPALVSHADTLAGLPPLTAPATDYAAAGALVRAAAGDARDAAAEGAWAAAGATAWDAAWATAWDAAWAAAKEAAEGAWSAADAAWAAADAAGAAAKEAAEGAWSVADAAWAAAKAAAEAAWAAADATWAMLAPTLETLRASAWDLLDRMIACGQEVVA